MRSISIGTIVLVVAGCAVQQRSEEALAAEGQVPVGKADSAFFSAIKPVTFVADKQFIHTETNNSGWGWGGVVQEELGLGEIVVTLKGRQSESHRTPDGRQVSRPRYLADVFVDFPSSAEESDVSLANVEFAYQPSLELYAAEGVPSGVTLTASIYRGSLLSVNYHARLGDADCVFARSRHELLTRVSTSNAQRTETLSTDFPARSTFEEIAPQTFSARPSFETIRSDGNQTSPGLIREAAGSGTIQVTLKGQEIETYTGVPSFLADVHIQFPSSSDLANASFTNVEFVFDPSSGRHRDTIGVPDNLQVSFHMNRDDEIDEINLTLDRSAEAGERICSPDTDFQHAIMSFDTSSDTVRRN